MTSVRIALSLPFSHVFADPAVAGPVFSSHMLDMQAFPATESARDVSVAKTPLASVAHVGPPTINVEVKLVGVAERGTLLCMTGSDDSQSSKRNHETELDPRFELSYYCFPSRFGIGRVV